MLIQDEKLGERLSGTVKAFQKHYLRLSTDRKPILSMGIPHAEQAGVRKHLYFPSVIIKVKYGYGFI